MSTQRSLGRLVASTTLFLVGCNALSGVYAYRVSEGSASDPADGSDDPPDTKLVDSSRVDEDSSAKDAESKKDAGGEAAADVLHVFVTSTKTSGSFGGLAEGDSICRARASAAERGGDWVAWLSAGSTGAASRITTSGPWYLFNGQLAVASHAELTSGSITAPVNVDETGTTGIADAVWTGTSASGATKSSCNGWNVNSCIGSCPQGTSGRTDVHTSGWTDNAAPECLGASLRLYCFQN